MNFFSDRSQHGNALWFILVAIVLLGALTVLLTRSGTSVNQSGDVEQIQIKVGQMIRWAKGLETAIEQMKLRGISESDISFENSTTAADYTNPNCTTNDCKVFAMGGGGQSYLRPPMGLTTNASPEWLFNGRHNIGSVENPIGTTAARSGNDIVLFLREIPDQVCLLINRNLNVGTSGILPDEATVDLEPDPFTGTFSNDMLVIDGNDTAHELNGKAAGCYFASGNGENIFYYVLLAR